MKIGMICSGGGGVLRSVERYGRNYGEYEIAVVVVDRACGARDYATERKINTAQVTLDTMAETLRYESVDAWICAYDRLLPASVIYATRAPILNVHFSLLPAFAGIGALRRQREAGCRFAGATVHVVDEGVDTGPIVAQGAFSVAPGAWSDDRAFFTACYCAVNVLTLMARGDLTIVPAVQRTASTSSDYSTEWTDAPIPAKVVYGPRCWFYDWEMFSPALALDVYDSWQRKWLEEQEGKV